MRLAAGQSIDKEQAFQHGWQVAIAHQAAGQPDRRIEAHAVGGGKRRQFFADAQALADLGQRHVVLARGEDQRGYAVAGQGAGLAQGLPETAGIIQRRRFQDLDAEGLDDRARIGAGHLVCRARQLNPVAVHDERHRRFENPGGMKAVQGVAGDPPGIAGMAQHPGIGTVGGALAEGLADGGGDHDAQASAVELGAPRYPGHVAGNVQPPPEGVHDMPAVDIAQGRQGREVADRGVGVFNREINGGMVCQRQRQQQGRDQVQAAPHVIHLVDLGQRGHGFDRQTSGFDLERFEEGDVLVGEPGHLLQVQMQGGDGRNDVAAHVERVGQKRLIALLLELEGGECSFHNGGRVCRKRGGASTARTRHDTPWAYRRLGARPSHIERRRAAPESK